MANKKGLTKEKSSLGVSKQINNILNKVGFFMLSSFCFCLGNKLTLDSKGEKNFLPDFVFWLQKGNEYHILYIGSKRTGGSEYQFKVDGYRDLFVDSEGSEENIKEFEFGDKKLKVHLKLATEDTAVFGDKDFYKKYWIEPAEFDIGFK